MHCDSFTIVVEVTRCGVEVTRCGLFHSVVGAAVTIELHEVCNSMWYRCSTTNHWYYTCITTIMHVVHSVPWEPIAEVAVFRTVM